MRHIFFWLSHHSSHWLFCHHHQTFTCLMGFCGWGTHDSHCFGDGKIWQVDLAWVCALFSPAALLLHCQLYSWVKSQSSCPSSSLAFLAIFWIPTSHNSILNQLNTAWHAIKIPKFRIHTERQGFSPWLNVLLIHSLTKHMLPVHMEETLQLVLHVSLWYSPPMLLRQDVVGTNESPRHLTDLQ